MISIHDIKDGLIIFGLVIIWDGDCSSECVKIFEKNFYIIINTVSPLLEDVLF